MNAYQLAKTAYSTPGIPTRTDRATEYALFADITRQLNDAASDRSKFPALATALHENRRMWTTLAADVADRDNALPQALRAQLFYLAEFTAQHSAKVLSGQASAAVLVDINTAVMRGLRQRGTGQ